MMSFASLALLSMLMCSLVSMLLDLPILGSAILARAADDAAASRTTISKVFFMGTSLNEIW
jgi:hypothetical protein